MSLARDYRRLTRRLEAARARLAGPNPPADDRAALEGLLAAEQRHDPATRAHTEKVAWYARRLARAAGWRPEAAADLQAAARLHDIGKLGWPPELLHNRGAVTDAQYARIKRHTTEGAARLLDTSPGPLGVRAAELALLHHERLDGHGYHGVGGDALPDSVRILAIADVFEALTAQRSYQRQHSPDEALTVMRRYQTAHGGRYFDDELLGRFAALAHDIHAEMNGPDGMNGPGGMNGSGPAGASPSAPPRRRDSEPPARPPSPRP